MNIPSTLSQKFSKNIAPTLVAMSALVLPAEAQTPSRENVIDLNKSFNMQVQLRPVSDPTNPDFRNVKVDCNKLDIAPNGHVIFTGRFVDQFDIPPLRPASGGADAAQGSVALTHIGSRIDGEHGLHQICVAQSEIYSGKGLRNPYGAHKLTINGQEFNLSVPFNNDRYCAPIAALKMCTKNTADDKSISNVYKLTTNGDVVLEPSNLK